MPNRVITYIDGFNLYYGIKKARYRWARWLNLEALSKSLLTPEMKLCQVKYFTTIVNTPLEKHDRQNEYLEALKTIPSIVIQYGYFMDHQIECYECHHTYTKYSEKKTDVNIAVSMILDAYNDQMDTAILISADSDLVNAVKAVKRTFKKQVIIAFPPKRSSKSLAQVAGSIDKSSVIHVGRSNLASSQFPDEVKKPDGTILRRPETWR